MQPTSELYKSLFADLVAGKPGVRYETRMTIGDTGTLIDRKGNSITFGGVRILVGSSGPDSGLDESKLISVKTALRVFSSDTPSVGDCVSSEIDVSLLQPAGTIPRQARLVPYVRLTDGPQHSEWLQQGVYFIDIRETSGSDSLKKMTLHGYDAMLKAEADYPPSNLQWPALDIDVVREIAESMVVSVDDRTVAIMTRGYEIEYPADYSQRETLGYIASLYAGCFVMSDLGELRLVQLAGIPPETSYLVTGDGQAITFGGVRIRV